MDLDDDAVGEGYRLRGLGLNGLSEHRYGLEQALAHSARWSAPAAYLQR